MRADRRWNEPERGSREDARNEPSFPPLLSVKAPVPIGINDGAMHVAGGLRRTMRGVTLRVAVKNHPNPEDYAGHVEHPRYGKAPRFTGLDPNPDSSGVHLHPNTRILSKAVLRVMKSYLGRGFKFPDDGTRMVPGTAVAADVSRQARAAVPVTHYCDIDIVCRDCRRRFIFFADEQKHWYEELGFPLEADADRCPPCRKHLRHVAQTRLRYEELFHAQERTVGESLEMAGCCLLLVEEGIFHRRQMERVRMLLNRIPENMRAGETFLDLSARVRAADPKGEHPISIIPAPEDVDHRNE